MKNGKYIIDATDATVKVTHIDQEMIEFARLNGITAQNRKNQEQAERDKAAANRAFWGRRQRLTAIVFGFVFGTGALLGLAHLGAIAGWVARLGILAGGIRLGCEFTK